MTSTLGMAVAVAVPLMVDVESVPLAILLFAVTLFPLLIAVNALYVASGRHLVARR